MMCWMPASAFNGINAEYYKKGNRMNQLRATVANMMSTYGAILAVFLFAIIEPTWEYNMKCEVESGKVIPCSYKIVFWPQLIVFFILFVGITVFFVWSLAKSKVKETLTGPEDNNWQYGCIYCNIDDDAVCVPKRVGIGYTINLGNSCGVTTCIALVVVPIIIVGLILLFLFLSCYKHKTLFHS
ncbi:hypothetical protein JH06_3678 [Blastocystis sp. subtype 4]|uniref:hypothetical protein n=1 Tax=Blastocystis sp. subtype 4 TaxID=944170 RepID=UPI0007113217|nr:hypothetical protein JH06_3678 [Blastocystis sp. subtype 4]KNB46788.1 hypothetical protein JH06_3678 [Blastocystis sp. subtype 4]|eukprot:XP_014530230.1 hypothetical protein JH06_3678 [Blastocystis sp. subtype 4]